MATKSVPGADPKNVDELDVGCWAEHDDGSLIFVQGFEGDSVVYQIYDLAQDPPVYYQDAMTEDDFKREFSFPPVGKSDIPWTWHDKTDFPWRRVMRRFDDPTPSYADVRDQMTAAQRVAESLDLRGQQLSEADVGAQGGSAGGILEKIGEAIGRGIERGFGGDG